MATFNGVLTVDGYPGFKRTAKLNCVGPMAWLAAVLEPVVSGRTAANELDSLPR